MCALFGICADVPGVLLELMTGFNVVDPNPAPATNSSHSSGSCFSDDVTENPMFKLFLSRIS